MAQGAAAVGRHSWGIARRSRPRRAALATLAVTLAMTGLAGCTKPAPDPSPTPSSTSASPTPTETSPSPTPSPTPPPKPEAWSRDDDTGALAAAQYFMDLYNYVIATGDLTEWKALAAPDCDFCQSVATTTASTYEVGGEIQGGSISVSDAAVVGRDEAFAVTTVELKYATTEVRDLGPDGAVTSSTPAEDGWVLVDLYYSGAGWQFYGADARDEPVR